MYESSFWYSGGANSLVQWYCPGVCQRVAALYLHDELPRYTPPAVGAMDDISAMDSMQKLIPNVTIRLPQIPPAVPPLVRGRTALIRARTQALPKIRLYPKMDMKRKFR